MVKTKGRKTRRKKRLVAGPIFVSPDGGETVYKQLANGKRKLISTSQLAMDTEEEYSEAEMIGVDAIRLRRKYPTLQTAWNQYKTVWNIVAHNDDE
jgi:hypothetical protein